MIKAVIFDLDGSMVDSMWIWRAIDIEYLGRFNIALPEKLQADIEGMSFSETAAYFKERFALPDSLEQIKADWNRMAWHKYEQDVPLKKGVLALLDYCKVHNILLGIATSNSRELVETVVRAHHLESYFDCIMTACEVEKGKPAPDIYLAVAKALQVSPADWCLKISFRVFRQGLRQECACARSMINILPTRMKRKDSWQIITPMISRS